MTAIVMPRQTLLVPRRIHVAPASEILLPGLDRAARRIFEDLLRRPRDIVVMAGSLSNYLSKKILDEFIGATDYAAAANTYGRLSTATIDDTTTGSTATDPTYTSYAAVSKTNNSTTWPNATGTTTATKSNGVAFGWPTSTGGSSTITYGYFADAATAGNILVWYSLTNSQTITTGDTPNLASSGYTCTLD